MTYANKSGEKVRFYVNDGRQSRCLNVLGRLGLPDRLPFSKCQVKALFHGRKGRSERGIISRIMDNAFRYLVIT